LECGKSRYSFECIEADDFPPFPKMAAGKEFSIDAVTFERGIRRTLFATNPDDPRAFMGGVYFGVESGGLAMVSTDGHRLTWFHVPGQAAPLGDKGVIVPSRTLTELLRIIPSPAKPEKSEKTEEGAEEKKPVAAGAKVAITVQEDAIAFSADGIYMISRLVKADYPNYDKVIPSEKLGECRVARGRLANAVRGTAIMARAKENQYIIEFNVDDSILQLSASTQDVGSAREEVDIEQKGSKISVSFNSRYILDFLNAVPEDEVVFQYSEALKATLFHTDNPDYKYVLMPIKM
jgi:DNA polymerase-3 subunit beta